MDCQNKDERYALLLEQVRSLVDGETDAVAIMANVAAAIHEAMGFFWTGFYRVVEKQRPMTQRNTDTKAAGMEQELLLGPFQGPVACTHIGYGRGVCGTAWKERRTIIVPDVEQFPGHIACSTLSRSEIVVPLFDGAEAVTAVLDIDSKQLATFDETDRQWLEKICGLLC